MICRISTFVIDPRHFNVCIRKKVVGIRPSTPISMRKSFDGLAGAVEEYIQQEPESGHAFVFFGRSRKMVKILQWQGDGFTIWMKRLESGAFHLPKSAEGRIELSSRELAALLSGIKPHRYYKRYSKKS